MSAWKWSAVRQGSELKALRRRVETLEESARSLVAALPVCDTCGLAAMYRGKGRYGCDAHRPDTGQYLDWTPPLRAMLGALGGRW